MQGRPSWKKVNEIYKKYSRGQAMGELAMREITGLLWMADVIDRAKSVEPAALQKAANETKMGPEQLIIDYKGVQFENGQNVLATGVVTQIGWDGEKHTLWPWDLASKANFKPLYPNPRLAGARQQAEARQLSDSRRDDRAPRPSSTVCRWGFSTPGRRGPDDHLGPHGDDQLRPRRVPHAGHVRRLVAQRRRRARSAAGHRADRAGDVRVRRARLPSPHAPRAGGDPFTQIFATIGLLFLLQNAVVAGFTSDFRFVNDSLSRG